MCVCVCAHAHFVVCVCVQVCCSVTDKMYVMALEFILGIVLISNKQTNKSTDRVRKMKQKYK